MKKVLMIIAPEEFRDEECFVPKTEFEKNGAQVTIASKGTGLKTGSLGGTINAKLDYKTVNPLEYDVIVFVGGAGARIYFEDSFAHKIARIGFDSGKIVSAICVGPIILAKSGILNRKSATVFPSGKIDVENSGAHYTGKDVTVDGKIVTASGPKAAQRFAEEIIKIW